VARRRWQPDDESPHFAWYEPLPPCDALDRAVAFVLGRDHLFLNTSSDARLLAAIVAAAEQRAPVSPDSAMQADVEAHEMRPLFDGAAIDRI